MEEMKTIKISDKNFPQELRKIKDCPKKLYFRGNIKPKENCFAVVGTRRNTLYGKETALEIAGEISNSGLTIVSGLAPGIDTFAHTAAVERKKRTIAVLGTGMDKKSIYPKSNLKLAEKIIETGGCLISEYPPGTRATKFTFPKRNRIVSGLCLGVLVVEAKEKSGSLITAGLAFSQKKKVFAVPGPIHSENSKGPHLLIKKGAKLIDSVDDILQELGLLDKNKQYKISLENATKEEKIVLNILKEGFLYIDDIVEKTGLPSSDVSITLVNLEIKGAVKNLGSNTFSINR